MRMNTLVTGLVVTLNLLAANAFADQDPPTLHVNSSISQNVMVIPASFSDDGNLGKMCNGDTQFAQNFAKNFDQKNNTYIAISSGVVTQTIPGQVNQAYLQQCEQGCDANGATCSSNVGQALSGCYTDSNNNYVCPISVVSGPACQQLASCQQNVAGCYQSCQQQAQTPPTYTHQCQISFGATQNFTFIRNQMTGMDVDCIRRINRDKVAGNVIYSDEYHQAGQACTGDELIIVKQ